MPRALGAALLVLLAAGPAFAEGPDYLLVGARQLVAEEPAFEVRLYATNSGDEPVAFELPDSLVGEIEADSGLESVQLAAVDPELPAPAELEPGGFAQRHYRGLLPLHSHGLVSLRIESPAPVLVHFQVAAAELHRVEPYSWGDGPEEDDDDLLDRILAGLMTYEPIYFIAGGDLSPVTAKYQLSAQYRILLEPLEPFEPESFWGHVWAGAHDIYMGYTQTSVWELSSPSAPFRGSSFRPAVYYLETDLFRDADLPWDRFGLQVGLEHESNGEGGDDSRSLNIVFARPIFTFDVGSHYHFTIAPKLYAYLEKTDNRDIDDYRGYVDLLLKFGRVDALEMTATLRKGTRKAYGSAQVDATFPIARISKYFGAFLHAQFFYGYGDTLLQYDENAGVQLRGGILIVPYGSLFP